MSKAHRQPSYRHHKPTNQAVVTLNGKDHYLGKHGTKDSREKYDRLLAAWLANGRKPLSFTTVTVAELIERFWAWAEQHY